MRDRSAGRADGHFANPNYKSDVKYTLEMCRWVTKPIGVWPFVYSRTSKLEKLVSIVLLAVCFSDLLFATIPPGHYLMFVEKNVYVIVKLLGPLGFCISSAIKYLYLVFKGNVFKRCLVHVERDWKTVVDERYRQIMVRQSSVSRQLIVLCAIFLYSGGMSYHTIMPFVSKPKMRGNQTLKPLIYPGYDAFFDSQASPTYEIIFSMHCLSGFIKYSITTGAYSLAATFVTHICGQVQIQIARLENLVESIQKNSDRNPVAVIVREHVEILRFSKNVEEALREICLTEIVESTFILCVLEYYCLVEWENSDVVAIFTYVMLLISFTFNITIFCYIGELLTEQCSKIGPAAYEIEWYNLPYKKAHDLILLSVVSNYPPKLTAGKIFTLSLNTFSSVMQSSVIYLNLLRQVMN
ncbi:odorant receptor 10-like [Lasioglossum baleicum]|uniref:odorant receptor 10-like n=1 Tax=Lasioglossum baleicum TaxID=434251 RepID=UPI003FCD2E3B